MGVVLHLRDARPSGPSLFPVGRTSNNLRGSWHLGKSWLHPGRVALVTPVFPGFYVASPLLRPRRETTLLRKLMKSAKTNVIIAHTAHAGGSTR